jgi:hypothetical protein
MPALLHRWRNVGAIAFTALIFGLIHLNPWQFFYALYLGAWLGWVYVRTRSIWPCVAGHAVNNGLAWLAGLLGPADAVITESSPEPPALLPWPVVMLSLAGVVACAAWLWRATNTQVTRNAQGWDSAS